MFHKIFVIAILLHLNLFAINTEFNESISEKFGKDFAFYGIKFDENTTTFSFEDSSILFQNGKNTLPQSLQIVLDEFFPKFFSVVLTHQNSIQKIVIKGHTSSANRLGATYKEKFLLNKKLSQLRADHFLDYLSTIKNKTVQENRDWIEKKFQAKGFSSSYLLYNKEGKEDTIRSRRIEITVVFYKNKDVKQLADEMYNQKKQLTIRLPKYIKRLLANNPTLQERFHILKSVESEINTAKSAMRPTLSLNVSHTQYTQSDPDDFSSIQSKDITMRYNIFNGFKDIEEIGIQKNYYQANEYLKEQIEGDLIYAVTEAFINIEKENEIKELSRKNLEDYDLWKSKEDVKFQNGVISLRNYAKIQSRDTTQRINYEEYKKRFEDSLSALQRYIDFDIQEIENFEVIHRDSDYLYNQESAFQDVIISSPYIKEANKNKEIYKQKLEQSKVNFYPTVNVIAKKSILDENYESADTVKTEETSLGLEASLALYSGGKDKANYEKKLSEYREKVAKQKEVIRDVYYQLDLAFNRYELYLEKAKLLKNLVTKREDSLLGATYDYKFAKIEANDLLDTVDDLYTAKKMYIENRYDITSIEYKIFNIMGIIKNIILDNEMKDY